MAIERINSLIKENFDDTLMKELERVFYARSFIDYPKAQFETFKGRFRSKDMGDKIRVLIVHNNDRIDLYKSLINNSWNKPVNFGTGTNRMAVISDSFVFKIAMDHAGCTDNLHEFIMSKELQPYVTKCYETNELISVSEYVNVISDKAQFENRKEEIMEILQELEACTSLMLDVGFITKNMTNWGVRPSDGKAVILDFGYLYTDLEGVKLTCSDQQCIHKHGISKLVYTQTYSHMECPNCAKEVTVLELQSLITSSVRNRMYTDKLRGAFKVEKPATYFKVDEFGDYVEMEEGNDSMIVTKKKRKENLEEVTERYKEICADYYADVILHGEASDNLQRDREMVRRMILEITYDMDYGDMELARQLEDPYVPEEVNPKRMVELENDPLNEFIESHVDKDVDYSVKERLKKEISEEDEDDIASTFMTYRDRDKIFSKMYVSRGETPLIEDYDEEDDNCEDEEEYTSMKAPIILDNGDPEFVTPDSKPAKRLSTTQDLLGNYGGMEIELGCEDDEDILNEASKFMEYVLSNDNPTSDLMKDLHF